jgi:thiamine biosynthesis lipoprotein
MAIASDRVRRARPLLGTFVEIEVAGAAQSEMAAAVDAAFEAVARVQALMSFHEDDSDVSRLNREARLRPIEVDAWTFRVLEAAVEMHRRSNGIFDIAVAPALQSMGLLPHPHRNDDLPITAEARPFDAIKLGEAQIVRFRHRDVRIDLGGIAKGFAVDQALEVLRASRMASGMVNAGGDLAAFGDETQTIHIRHPRDPGRLMCRVDVANEALASSARRFDPFAAADTTSSAIIDPRLRAAAGAVDGATVRAPSCMIADALTKIVMISGTAATELLEHYHASALLVSTDGDVRITPDWHHAVHLAA